MPVATRWLGPYVVHSSRVVYYTLAIALNVSNKLSACTSIDQASASPARNGRATTHERCTMVGDLKCSMTHNDQTGKAGLLVLFLFGLASLISCI